MGNRFDEKKYIKIVEETSNDIHKEHLSSRPGKEHEMETKPMETDDFIGAGRLKNKVAIVTGGDSGIGKAVSIAYAKEGAKVVVVYLEESNDAEDTKRQIEKVGSEVLLIMGDIGSKEFCQTIVESTIEKFGKLDILVNNAGIQHPQKNVLDISEEQLLNTFRSNFFSMFFMTQAALPYLKENDCIINTSSVTSYEGNKGLIDYSATKGAITAFTRSLAQNLSSKKIRVNQIAPGPIWTPLIPSTFDPEHVENFGGKTLLNRAGQPIELVEAYIMFAWARGNSFITGQTIHINGGQFLES